MEIRLLTPLFTDVPQIPEYFRSFMRDDGDNDRCLMYRSTDMGSFLSLDISPWATKMAQQVKVLASKSSDLSSIPRGHKIVRGLVLTGCPLTVAPVICGHIQMYMINEWKCILDIGLKHFGITVLFILM